jgi:hypothetical protein
VRSRSDEVSQLSETDLKKCGTSGKLGGKQKKNEHQPIVSEETGLLDSSASYAIGSQRLYHRALPPDRITSELETNRATQFPPEAIDVFQGMVKHKATD